MLRRTEACRREGARITSRLDHAGSRPLESRAGGVRAARTDRRRGSRHRVPLRADRALHAPVRLRGLSRHLQPRRYAARDRRQDDGPDLDARNGTLLHDLKPRRGQAPSDSFRAAVSPDGRLVAAMDASGSLASVWDIERGERIAELRNRGADVPRLAFSADGWLATTGGEEARVFDVRRWTQVRVIPGPVQSLAFDAQSRLVTGSSNGEVALWSIPRRARLRQLRASGEPVHAVAFSRDGTLVAAGSDDGAVLAWRTDDGSLRSQLNPRHGKVVGIEFDPSAASLLAASADGTVTVADAAQGLPLAIWTARRTRCAPPASVRTGPASSARPGTAPPGCGQRPRRIGAGPRSRSATAATSA
jgi:WD40 repeat protein